MRVVVVVQARMGSTRLPGKILMPLAGKPILGHVLERAAAFQGVDHVVVATTDRPVDDVVEEWATKQSWSVFRGSETDVLGRFFDAAIENEADAVVRITADNPAIDPEMGGHVVERLRERHQVISQLLVTNCLVPGKLVGLGVEGIGFPLLDWLNRELVDPEEREHVTLHVRRHPRRFDVIEVAPPRSLADLGARLTVDTMSDYERMVRLFEDLTERHGSFGYREIVAYLSK